MNPFIAPLLTEIVINEMTCAGSILIVGVGLNLLKVTNIRIMNTVPVSYTHLTLPTKA